MAPAGTGLFSAQVVPNDEIVSKEEGKKIFAFSDEILQTTRAKPFLKLSNEIFGQEANHACIMKLERYLCTMSYVIYSYLIEHD